MVIVIVAFHEVLWCGLSQALTETEHELSLACLSLQDLCAALCEPGLGETQNQANWVLKDHSEQLQVQGQLTLGSGIVEDELGTEYDVKAMEALCEVFENDLGVGLTMVEEASRACSQPGVGGVFQTLELDVVLVDELEEVCETGTGEAEKADYYIDDLSS